MLHNYESTIILKSGLAEDQVTAVKTKVEGIVAAHAGQVVNFEDWGTRKMTYPIAGDSRGRYIYLTYTGNNALVAEIERNLRINEGVVRYLSVSLPKEVDLEMMKQPSAMKRPPRAPSDNYQQYD